MYKQKIYQRKKISIKYFNIIYEVIDEANKIIEGLFEDDFTEKKLIEEATIKKVFNYLIHQKIAGCLVEEGKVLSKSITKILREEKIIQEVEIQSLRRKKPSKREVQSGLECGISFNKF